MKLADQPPRVYILAEDAEKDAVTREVKAMLGMTERAAAADAAAAAAAADNTQDAQVETLVSVTLLWKQKQGLWIRETCITSDLMQTSMAPRRLCPKGASRLCCRVSMQTQAAN